MAETTTFLEESLRDALRDRDIRWKAELDQARAETEDYRQGATWEARLGDEARSMARQLAETLEKDVLNRAVHPDIALRVALVDLTPIREALKRYNSER